MNVGDTYGPYKFTFDKKRAQLLEKSIGTSDYTIHKNRLPPTAIIALGLAELIEELSLFRKDLLDAGGVIHATQEAEFFMPVKIGEEIIANAKLTGNSVRGASRFLTISSNFVSDSNKKVATASSTIILPI